MIKAILFDLDGTLLDREASVEQFISTQYNRFALAQYCIPKDNYISRFIELDCRGYVWKDKVYQSIVSEFSIKTLSWQDLLHDYENQFIHSCVPFPHMQSTLDILKTKEYLLGMITNGLGRFQTRTIEGLGIEKYFEVILISDVEGGRLANPKGFINDKLRVSPLPIRNKLGFWRWCKM